MTNCTATTPELSPPLGRACCCPGCRIVWFDAIHLRQQDIDQRVAPCLSLLLFATTIFTLRSSNSVASTSPRSCQSSSEPQGDDSRFGLTEVIVLIISNGPRVSPPKNLAMIAMLTSCTYVILASSENIRRILPVTRTQHKHLLANLLIFVTDVVQFLALTVNIAKAHYKLLRNIKSQVLFNLSEQ